MNELKQKVGALLQIGFDGFEPPAETRRLISEWSVNNFILFKRNYRSPRQLWELTTELRKLAGDRPPFIAVDQEGGAVKRFIAPFYVLPAAGDFGDIKPIERAIELAAEAATIAGRQLVAAGINWNHAPVADLNTNRNSPVIGRRAYSADPTIASALVAATVRGYRNTGLLCTAKHFPGHGDAAGDSHFDLPSINLPRERLIGKELVPFRAAVEAGADAVMVAHLMVDAIDRQQPASLSPECYRLLVDQLSESPLRVTDDLEMKAIADRIGVVEGATAAISAGADMALICHDVRLQAEALETIYKKALDDGGFAALVLRAAGRVEKVRLARPAGLNRFDYADLEKLLNDKRAAEINRLVGGEVA